MAQYSIRWAQLDLARQMESIEFIEQFIELISASGYNGLFLYLEDRIRTASYSFPAENECYTQDEIKHIIAFAADRGIEVIPCVATLGHAERFLRHKELEHLAELQGEMTGRFEGRAKLTFCVTHPEFYDFIGKYLEEVAALFPSQWFHIGLDEFWDFNLCERCRQRMPKLSDEEEMFLEHICKIRGILSQCGKRVMMWSDMFEFYPHIFKRVPEDVVLVDWQYHNDVRCYQGHLLDVGNEDRLSVNAACGHDTIIAPADKTLHNSQSYIDYAAGKERVIGGLMTCWELTDTYLYRTLPCFVSAGFQMNGSSSEEAYRKMLTTLFGTDDEVFAAAVAQTQNLGMFRHFEGITESAICTRGYFGIDFSLAVCEQSIRTVLASFRGKVSTEFGVRTLEDMINCLDDKILSRRANIIAHEIIDLGVTAERIAKFRQFRQDYSAFIDRMSGLWSTYRPGITPNYFEECREKVENSLQQIEESLSSNSWIRVSIALPDGYGVEHTAVEYQIDGQWHSAGSGCFKAETPLTALFSRFLLIKPVSSHPVEAIRITSKGLGGNGLTFAEANINGKRYIPSAILSVAGRVTNPEYLLSDDTNFAWFGGQSTRSDYFDVHAAKQEHSVTLAMSELRNDDLVFNRLV